MFRLHPAVAVALLAIVTGCSHPPAGRPAGAAVLSCHDSAGQQAADPQARPLNGVESVALNGDTNPGDSLPAWRASDGQRYLIWKVFLAVAASARPYRIVSVMSPASARLFYSSPTKWGAVSSSKVVAALPRRVQLPVCGTQYTGYTGGILVTHSACVTLAISGPGRRAVAVTVPVLVSHC